MLIFVDIDNTICQTDGMNYEASSPYPERIKKINQLFEEGHTIVYYTARGYKTGIPWFQTTHQQLKDWGCLFHELRMGKPNYDLFIDDKNINADTYFSS